jgi:hypothetical protein
MTKERRAEIARKGAAIRRTGHSNMPSRERGRQS